MSYVRTLLFTSATLALAAGLSLSATAAENSEREGRRGPPPEAIDACTALVEGDACSFTGRRSDVQGSCIVRPRNEEALICAPTDRPRDSTPRRENDET